MAPLLLVLRLLVMGVGLGVIAGTSLRLLAPRLALGASSQNTSAEPAPGFGTATARPAEPLVGPAVQDRLAGAAVLNPRARARR